MWEQTKQINFLLRKKVRRNGNQRMFVIIRCRILCLEVSYSKLRYTDV